MYQVSFKIFDCMKVEIILVSWWERNREKGGRERGFSISRFVERHFQNKSYRITLRNSSDLTISGEYHLTRKQYQDKKRRDIFSILCHHTFEDCFLITLSFHFFRSSSHVDITLLSMYFFLSATPLASSASYVLHK